MSGFAVLKLTENGSKLTDEAFKARMKEITDWGGNCQVEVFINDDNFLCIDNAKDIIESHAYIINKFFDSIVF